MMRQITAPERNVWPLLAQRPMAETRTLTKLVNQVFDEVKTKGDQALYEYSQLFDQVDLTGLAVSREAIQNACENLPEELKLAIQLAKGNIEKFHASQKETASVVETTRGVYCWRESRPIERIGIYIPGGTAPLFSTVLMLGIPAKIAGCREIILCTPPDKNGNVSPAILYAANLVGVDSIVCVGGIQAIAAMTFGTESIPKVDKIFGPGNQYVTAAKQAAQNEGVAIDLPAGPSEVLIIADQTCDPAFVAADLLSQAEHGADSQVILLTCNELLASKILLEVTTQLELLPRKDLAALALMNSKSIVLKTTEECIEFSNLYAPEHLILALENAVAWIPGIRNAGSVFIGNYSCESAGDYASGTNHTLPTNGYARNYSGVSLDSFLKKITFQRITEEGIKNIGPAIEILAEAEGLFAHRNAVTMRLNKLENV